MIWKKWFSKNTVTPEKLGDFRAVVVSDIGCIRANNEDAARFIRPAMVGDKNKKDFLAIVADGMGGHASGEVASLMAVEIVSKTYYQRTESPEESLFFAFNKANRSIFQAANKNSKYRGMGTTCTALVISENKLFMAHIGDSRLYMLRDGQLKQLSTDHTYIQSLIEQGILTATEAEKHPDRNVLTRAMGTKNSTEIDVQEINELFEGNDRILICSDGLYDYLSSDEMSQFLAHSVLNESAHAMIELAKQRGGHDNITVLLIERVAADAFQPARPTQNIEES